MQAKDQSASANIFRLQIKPKGFDKVKKVIADNQIAIGWSDAAQLIDPDLTKKQFTDVIHSVYYPNLPTRRKAGSGTSSMWPFLRDMKVGDFVIVPHGSEFYLGRIAGPAEYKSSLAKSEDTAFRRDAKWINGGRAYPRSVLSPELRKELGGRGACRMINKFRAEVMTLVQTANAGLESVRPDVDTHEERSRLYAVEGKASIRKAMQIWHRAFEKMHSEHAFSRKMLWIKDLGIWMEAGRWLDDKEAPYFTQLGNRLGTDQTRNVVVEVNPPNGVSSSRWQGLVAEGNGSELWLLHAGEMNAGGKRVHIHDFSDSNVRPRLVRFPDGTEKSYYPVARLDVSPVDIALQTRKFMDLCLRVRVSSEDADPSSVAVQEAAHLFEESIGLTVIPPQPEKRVEREHARIHKALVEELKSLHLDLSNETVGALGPDLYTIGGTHDLLFEIKTSCGAGDYLKGVGQLLVYEKALMRSFRKFLVVPSGLAKLAASILHQLDIEIVPFVRKKGGYSFQFPHSFTAFGRPLSKAKSVS